MSALRWAFGLQATAPEMCEAAQETSRGQNRLSVLLVAAFIGVPASIRATMLLWSVISSAGPAAFGKLPAWVLAVMFFRCGSLTLLLMRQSCYAPEAVLSRAAVCARSAAPQSPRRPFACRVPNVSAGCGGDGAGVLVSGAAGFPEASR